MKLIFPASYMSSQLSMTGLLILLGVFGNPQLAADVGIVQGAALALFYTFSGNARNLILKSSGVAPVREIALARFVLALPLSLGVGYLSTLLSGVAWELTSVLVARKTVEWFTEIHLSEAERSQDAEFAVQHLIVQAVLLVIIAVWVVADVKGLLDVLIFWALAPLMMSLRFLWSLRNGEANFVPVKIMIPHLGSSAVMGIGVYVFRLSIILLAGKRAAGDLYTAFAIGGVLGSIFAAGFGPSLVFHEQTSGESRMPRWLSWLLGVTCLSGLIIAGLADSIARAAISSGERGGFWTTVGYSMIGSVVMVFAHRQRLRDLQGMRHEDVFAPDVLSNMLIVALVPGIYYVFGGGGAFLAISSECFGMPYILLDDRFHSSIIDRSR